MQKIDKLIIDKVDAWMTKLQRHGYSLWPWRTTLADAAALVSLCGQFVIANGSIFLELLGVVCYGVFWGVLALWEHSQARENADYMSSPNMINRLNATCLMRREGNYNERIFSFSFMLLPLMMAYFAYFFVSTSEACGWILLCLGWLVQLALAYVKTAFFIGPNEFAKDKAGKMEPARAEIAS